MNGPAKLYHSFDSELSPGHVVRHSQLQPVKGNEAERGTRLMLRSYRCRTIGYSTCSHPDQQSRKAESEQIAQATHESVCFGMSARGMSVHCSAFGASKFFEAPLPLDFTTSGIFFKVSS